jgi:hypothetical protein
MHLRAARLVVALILAILAVSSLVTRYWFSALFWGGLALLAGHPFLLRQDEEDEDDGRAAGAGALKPTEK